MGQVIRNNCGTYVIVKESGEIVRGKVYGVHENGKFRRFEVRFGEKVLYYCTKAYMDRWIGEDVER